jgi:hypothetical protein
MTEFEKFAHVLALTESHDSPYIWGDEGLAVGRWQIHPAWYHDWRVDPPAVDASWNTVFHAALEKFWHHYAAMGTTPIKMAMIFHLGHYDAHSGKWDETYAVRFVNFWAQVSG